MAIVQAEFMAIPSDLGVKQLTKKQLSKYNYTFPKAANVSERSTVEFN